MRTMGVPGLCQVLRAAARVQHYDQAFVDAIAARLVQLLTGDEQGTLSHRREEATVKVENGSHSLGYSTWQTEGENGEH